MDARLISLDPDGYVVTVDDERSQSIETNGTVTFAGRRDRSLRRRRWGRSRARHRRAWSPDGTRIAVASDSGGSSDLYVMDANGGNIRALTDHPSGDWSPTWSPQ